MLEKLDSGIMKDGSNRDIYKIDVLTVSRKQDCQLVPLLHMAEEVLSCSLRQETWPPASLKKKSRRLLGTL